MIEILSIKDFQDLPPVQRTEVLKGLKTKDRLEQFLEEMNGKKAEETPEWVPCDVCGSRGHVLHIPRDNSDIHPSQIPKCVKKLWYDCSGQTESLEEHISPRLRMIFDMGHGWHAAIQRYGSMGAWGLPYHKEVPIDPDFTLDNGQPLYPVAANYWIKGAADALIPRYEINTPSLGDVVVKVVHEYKTINSPGYSKLHRPKADHKWQATMYSAVFDAPIVVYLYTNKDNCQMADFPVPFDPVIWNKITEKIELVQNYTEKEEPPPWVFTSAQLKPGECLSCGYLEICSPPQVKKKGK